jgi:hypothetical protein
MSLWFPWHRRKDDSKKESQHLPSELRIATSGSFSIRATVKELKIDGPTSHTRVRAALFVPTTCTTLQFQSDGAARKKPSANTRTSCVHVVPMFTPVETANLLDDAIRIGTAIGWSDRGVSLPTMDVLVQNMSKESQEMVFRAIREQLLPFARKQYPHLSDAFDKQPYPRPGNLFIVRYSAASGRPGGRGLKMHKDETALTFNLCLSPQDAFEGGGTYFPAASADVDGLLLRPMPGYCLVHDGNIRHAGNVVTSGDRFILVGFYNADGRDRAGEEEHFSKQAVEEARQRALASPRPPVQTIYFATAVSANLAPVVCNASIDEDNALAAIGPRYGGSGGATGALAPSASCTGGEGSSLFGEPQAARRPLSTVAIQGPTTGEERLLLDAARHARRPSGDVGSGCDAGGSTTPFESTYCRHGITGMSSGDDADGRPGEPHMQWWVDEGATGSGSSRGELRLDVPLTPSTPEMQRRPAPHASTPDGGGAGGMVGSGLALPHPPASPVRSMQRTESQISCMPGLSRLQLLLRGSQRVGSQSERE